MSFISVYLLFCFVMAKSFNFHHFSKITTMVRKRQMQIFWTLHILNPVILSLVHGNKSLIIKDYNFSAAINYIDIDIDG